MIFILKRRGARFSPGLFPAHPLKTFVRRGTESGPGYYRAVSRVSGGRNLTISLPLFSGQPHKSLPDEGAGQSGKNAAKDQPQRGEGSLDNAVAGGLRSAHGMGAGSDGHALSSFVPDPEEPEQRKAQNRSGNSGQTDNGSGNGRVASQSFGHVHGQRHGYGSG